MFFSIISVTTDAILAAAQPPRENRIAQSIVSQNKDCVEKIIGSAEKI
jgi:hypothetical protein